MIEFEVQDKEGLYVALLTPKLETEKWVETIAALNGTLSKEELQEKFGKRSLDEKVLQLGYIPLPDPASEILMIIRSNGAYYWGYSQIKFSEGCDVDSVAQNITNKLESSDDVVKIGKSLLFMGHNDPLFVVSKPYHSVIEIEFGRTPTVLRKLDSFDQFCSHMDAWAGVLTRVVNAMYDAPVIDIKYPIHI